jgi:hypothetical protein
MMITRFRRLALAAVLVIPAAAGAQWTAVGSNTGISSGSTSFNDLIRDNTGNLYLAYFDSSLNKGFVVKHNGTSWSNLGSSSGTTTHKAYYNTLALNTSNDLFYGYQDSSSTGAQKLTVDKFSNNAWTNMVTGLTAGPSYHNSMVTDADGRPVILSRDLSTGGGKLTAKRYDGTNWVGLGAVGFGSYAPTYYATLVMGSNDTAYAATIVPVLGVEVYKAHKAAPTTTSWQSIGNGGSFSALTSNSIYQVNMDLAIDGQNRLYVAYVTNTGSITVKRLTNGVWSSIGAENFTAGSAKFLSLAVTSAGHPYIAFSDGASSNATTVMHYDGTQWAVVGTSAISSGAASFHSLVLNSAGQPVVAFSDAGNGGKTRILQYNPPCAGTDPAATVGSTGCVTFTYDGAPVTYTTVRAGDDEIWLQQNIGSGRVATGQTDSLSYGDVFQWGRWADGHQKRNAAVTTTAPSPNNPSGLNGGSVNFIGSTTPWWDNGTLTDTWTAPTPSAATATNGCDPCRALGNGWRLPTQQEWQNVISGESITTPANAYSSNLKLTTGGNRNSSGGYDFVGVRGYYWSSTTSSVGGKNLYYSSFIINPSAGGLREQGMSVRCIKKMIATIDSVKVGVSGNAAPAIYTNGGFLQMTATVYPATSSQAVTWSVVPVTGTATISNTGILTASGNGTVWAKAISVADATKFDSMLVTISGQVVNVDSVRVKTQQQVPAVINTAGGTLALQATVYPATANQAVTWSIASPATATVSNTGVVTAVTNGTVRIMATSVADATKKDSIEVTITNQVVNVDSVVVRTSQGAPSVINTLGGTLQLEAQVYPAAANQSVTWSVQPLTGAALVSTSGLVTAQQNGLVWVKAVSVTDATKFDSLQVQINAGPATGIHDANKQNGVQLYPNPVQENLVYVLPAQMHDATIKVYNVAGVVCYSLHAASQTGNIPVAAWPAGMYYISVTSDAGVFTAPFIKR